MKKIIILLIALSLGVSSQVIFGSEIPEKTVSQRKVGLQKGDILKPFKLYTYPEGRELTNESFKGKITILNFAATWCPYCLEEKKAQEIFIAENPELMKKINLVPIMMDSKKDIDKYIENHGFKMTLYQDRNSEVGDDFVVRATPTTIIIDENGIVLTRHAGIAEYDLVKNYLKTLGVK